MGKVLNTFTNGFPGAVSRAADDIVTAMPNREESAALGYGVPVVLDSAKKGVKLFMPSSAAADLVGLTVRSGSKTPDAYGSSVSEYAPGEMADVLVRGSTVVHLEAGTAAPGGSLYVRKATGKLVVGAEGTGGADTVELSHIRFRTAKDVNNNAEVVILERNLQ